MQLIDGSVDRSCPKRYNAMTRSNQLSRLPPPSGASSAAQCDECMLRTTPPPPPLSVFKRLRSSDQRGPLNCFSPRLSLLSLHLVFPFATSSFRSGNPRNALIDHVGCGMWGGGGGEVGSSVVIGLGWPRISALFAFRQGVTEEGAMASTALLARTNGWMDS